jgi:signal transduction histidine kinase
MSYRWTLTMRTWLALALVLVLVVPVVTAQAYTSLRVAWATIIQTAPPDRVNSQHEAISLVAANRRRWSDPAWQRTVHTRLATWDLGVELLDGSGRLLYRQPANAPEQARSAAVPIVIMQGSRRAGTARLYPLWKPDLSLSVLVGLILLSLVPVVLVSGWVIGRIALRPLDALSRATQQVAGGDLDVSLPSSRVREIAAVAGAFTAMSESLRAALTREADAEQERRLFVGALVHDLRTPLFALRMRLEGLEQGLAHTPEQAARHLAICRAKADALERLIGDLAAYTRMEYLDQAPNVESLELGALLERAVEAVQPQAEVKGIALVLDGPGTPCPLMADGHLLTRAVDNLLDNALRHTPGGGRITVAWTATGEQLVVQVIDTGPGIPTRDLPHVFAPLYRGESSRNRRTGGAGLGLAIAQRIFQVHGGELTAANRVTGGAAFTGVLPRERRADPPLIGVAG